MHTGEVPVIDDVNDPCYLYELIDVAGTHLKEAVSLTRLKICCFRHLF